MSGHFIEAVCECSIVEGNVQWSDKEGRRMFMPLRLFRQQHARHSKMLTAYDARKAEVVKMSPRTHQAAS